MTKLLKDACNEIIAAYCHDIDPFGMAMPSNLDLTFSFKSKHNPLLSVVFGEGSHCWSPLIISEYIYFTT